jgi:flavin reductase (DIM6/NTAB) family NADH-FMN oxidoreductase RutF
MKPQKDPGEKSIQAFNAQLLRAVMRQWTTGVTVVTSAWKAERHGMTVSSFTSISLVPPLVSISIARETRTYALIHNSGIFGVTILRDSQQEISDRFAGRIKDSEDRFIGLDSFTLVTGTSFLVGGLAWLDCQVVSKLAAGDNYVFIGQVLEAKSGEIGSPLLYFDRNYHNLCEE